MRFRETDSLTSGVYFSTTLVSVETKNVIGKYMLGSGLMLLCTMG